MLGMELFKDVIPYNQDMVINSTNASIPVFECGTYEQLEYWANNFNDFAVSPFSRHVKIYDFVFR